MPDRERFPGPAFFMSIYGFIERNDFSWSWTSEAGKPENFFRSRPVLLLPLPNGRKISEVNSMKNQVSDFTEFRAYYLSEFEWFDGEAFVTFNLVGLDLDRKEVQVAVTNRGRISVVTYDLLTDKNGRLYFEYGVMFERVYLDEFEEAA